MTKEEIISGLENAAVFLSIHHGETDAISAAIKLIKEME